MGAIYITKQSRTSLITRRKDLPDWLNIIIDNKARLRGTRSHVVVGDFELETPCCVGSALGHVLHVSKAPEQEEYFGVIAMKLPADPNSLTNDLGFKIASSADLGRVLREHFPQVQLRVKQVPTYSLTDQLAYHFEPDGPVYQVYSNSSVQGLVSFHKLPVYHYPIDFL